MKSVSVQDTVMARREVKQSVELIKSLPIIDGTTSTRGIAKAIRDVTERR